jgi:Kef-type K+ transport system membrane component KefB
MSPITHNESVTFLVTLSVLLASARLLGGLAKRYGQPPVLGELTAGVLLGPSVLGLVRPGAVAWLFPSAGPRAVALDALTKLAIVLFLLCAGLEVELSSLRRQGRAAVAVSLAGLAFPFTIGFAVAWALPQLVGSVADKPALVLPMFLGTALSISALPVIAKILRDLGLYRTDVGVLIVASAVVDDLVGWMLFATVLGMAGEQAQGVGLMPTCVLTLAFAGLVLTVGRRLARQSLGRWGAGDEGRGAGIGVVLVLGLSCAAFTEWAGTHANFGAFLLGVAIGDSPRLNRRALRSLDDVVSAFLAPLFFASVGLKVDFIAHFDGPLVLLVLAIATSSKIFGCWLGARAAGVPDRKAWAIGCGMNARGAMEIVLALLALQAGVIGEPLFVAVVVMALVTSAASGVLIRSILGPAPGIGTASTAGRVAVPTETAGEAVGWRAPLVHGET